MVAADSSDKWKKIIFIVLGIFALIIILITFFIGISGLRQFFVWLLGIILVLTIIFGLLYVFWLIFLKKTFLDIPANYRKKLLKTAKMMKNEMLGTLYLSGDTKHNRIKVGRYYYMRMTLPKQTREVILKGNKPHIASEIGGLPQAVGEEKQEIKEYTEPVPIDAFFIIKKGIMDTLFGNPIVILVKPEDHDYSSIFNDVTLKGFNLVPLDSQFYTINTRDIDSTIIKGVAQNYIREVVYEIFRDLDKLVKQAMNLDQQFQKDKQRGLEFEIPSMPQVGMGGQQQR